MTMLRPLNFQQWIDEHRELLKPPVGNAQIWADREFMVTVVGGPNARTDYHVNQGEEFFYQIEGEINLRLRVDGKVEDLPIRAGEIFLLPPSVPHSPQRPAGTVGLVLERRRLPGELDGFQWFCERCDAKLYEEFFHLTDIVAQLPPVFARYWGDPEHTTCKQCGQLQVKPAAAAAPQKAPPQ
jgi:3-hydroxyanthranilate 3,4-dioxygenase